MHFHWQNLNERPACRLPTGQHWLDGPKGVPYYGRAWLSFARLAMHVEWNFWSTHTGIYFRADSEGWHFFIGLLPVAFWFGIEGGFFTQHNERELSLKVHDWSLWWNLWTSSDSWSSKTPRYRNGAFHVLDFVFGKTRYEERPLACEWVEVPMPERTYYGVAQLAEATWRRARWFPRRLLRVELKMLPGEQVPHPGKGENSWDCGEDATYGLTTPASTVEEGIAHLVGSVLRSRRRYGGRQWRPEALRAA